MALQRSPPLGLLDLPLEVRQQIYRHLFCHTPSPITLGCERFFGWASFSPFDEAPEPTFYTALFRTNKALSRDALHFAYSANSFRFVMDIDTFSKLGLTALASIRSLRVYKNAWLNSSYTTTFWKTLGHSCLSLEILVVEVAAHVVLGAIPYLKDYMMSISATQPKPKLLLDLTVLDRHFSFDFPERDYQSALQELHENISACDTSSSILLRSYAMRLPRQVKEIRFVVDIGAGAYRALHETLQQSTDLGFVKTQDIASMTSDGMESRGKRHLYLWQEGTG